jgi:hypothetical protein
VVHCEVSSPYLSPSYPTEGGNSGKGYGYCNVPRGYTRRRRNIGRFGIGAIPSCNLMMQLKDMEKANVVGENAWCTTFRSEGHHKDECPTL